MNLKRLDQAFAAPDAADLALLVDRLHLEFYEVKADANETQLESADRAIAVFAANHPELSAEAIDALRWCYSYDWR